MKKIAVCMLLLAVLTGCTQIAHLCGADVITDNLKEADTIRHKYSMVYISETIPLIESSDLPIDKKAEMLDMGKQLLIISEKENKLIVGE